MFRLAGSRRAIHWVLAVGGLLLWAPPTWACKEGTSSFLDWERCWSGLRLGLWVLSLGVSWFLCFHVFFSAKLQPRNSAAPWPLTAFGQCLSWFVGLAGLSFLMLFTVLSDELRRGGWQWAPSGGIGTFLNTHWPWLAIVIFTLAGMAVVRWRVRHYEEESMPA